MHNFVSTPQSKSWLSSFSFECLLQVELFLSLHYTYSESFSLHLPFQALYALLRVSVCMYVLILLDDILPSKENYATIQFL